MNTQIEIKSVPVQAATATKDLDDTDIVARRPPQLRYQFHRQGDRCPVRKPYQQCMFRTAVPGVGSPRLRFRRTSPARRHERSSYAAPYLSDEASRVA